MFCSNRLEPREFARQEQARADFVIRKAALAAACHAAYLRSVTR